MLGVHVSTVKRWCEGGDLPFRATDGGHRRIDIADALETAESKGRTTFLDGFSPWQTNAWLAIRDLEQFGDYRRFHNLAMGWLRRGEVELLGLLFFQAARRPEVPLPQFLDEGIRGFMAAVGEGWRSGRLAIGEEHMATQMIVEVLIRLRDDWEGRMRGRKGSDTDPLVAVVGSMEGDHHDLGAHGIRTLLERAGWRVYFLGPNVPAQDFAEIQRSQGADLLCISCSPNRTIGDVRRAATILGSRLDPAYPYRLVFGGSLLGIIGEDLPSEPFRSLDFFSSSSAFVDWLNDLPSEDQEIDEWRAA